MGQVNDWMNEIYPRWVAAHGVMIVTPVYWYQAPSVLKLMIDRLVCADGGNPDPTTTRGKEPAKAKALELAAGTIPRHLAGRAFARRRARRCRGRRDAAPRADRLAAPTWSWSRPAPSATLDRYIGYYEPYATSHEALDRDEASRRRCATPPAAWSRPCARCAREVPPPDAGLEAPRPK